MSDLRKIYAWLLLSPALLPLVFTGIFIYPYTTPKTLLLRSVAIVLAALFAYFVAAGEEFYWSRLKNKFTWVPGALLAVEYLTSIIGIDFYRSFWSIYARGDGLLTATAITVLFYLVLLSADKRFFVRVSKLSAWVGSFAAIFAILQWIKITTGLDIPIIIDPGARVGGTLDNAAFLASYLALTFFAMLAVAGEYSGAWRNALYTGAGLQMLAIVLAATRGSFVALGVVLLLALVYWGWGRVPEIKPSKKALPESRRRLRTCARASVISLVILGAIFFVFRGQLAHVPFEPVRRVATISLQDNTVSSRFFIWQHVGALALEKPLTGYGAEHVSELFDRVYDPSAIIEQWFDRTHNAFLDYFVQYGVFGLLLYVALILRLGYVGWRLFKQGNSFGVYLFLISIVYSVQNFFVFDTSSTLWMLLAFLAAGEILLSDQPAVGVRSTQGIKILGGVIAAALLVLLVPVTFLPAEENLYLADAYVTHVSDAKASAQSLQSALDLQTYGNLEVGYEAYEMFTSDQLTALKGTDLQVVYTETELVLEANYDRFPYDARTALYLAHVLASAPPGISEDVPKLQQVIDHVIALSPKRAQPWYLKANLSIQEGDTAVSPTIKAQAYARAIDVLKQYSALVPDLPEPRFVLASLFLTLGDKATAAQWADGALQRYKGDATVAKRAVKYYLAIEDWPHTVQFLQDIVNKYPLDYATTYDLAKANYMAGDKVKAAALVAHLRSVDPGYVESDPAFLKALGE